MDLAASALKIRKFVDRLVGNVALELLYRCDGVDCHNVTNKIVQDRWNLVTRLNPEMDESTFHFCTVSCMIRFFETPWEAE